MSLDDLFVKDKTRLVLIQSDASQNALPLLRQAAHVTANSSSHSVIVLSVSTPPSLFETEEISNVRIVDHSTSVKGYTKDWKDPIEEVKALVASYPPSSPLSIIIDSPDSLTLDYSSPSRTAHALRSLLLLINARPTPSRLILSLSTSSPLRSFLIPPSFSPSLTILTMHTPLLLLHLAHTYLAYPPRDPSSSSSPENMKFWALFLPASERGEGEQLAYASDLSDTEEEIVRVLGRTEGVVEVLSRGLATSSRKKGVERRIEGWKIVEERGRQGGRGEGERGVVKTVPWMELESLRSLVSAPAPGPSSHRTDTSNLPTTSRPATQSHSKHSESSSSDPMANLSFNLTLTEDQQAARAQVPLPYAHEGRGPDTGAILYDPDSADDVDDDDPDEDLDI